MGFLKRLFGRRQLEPEASASPVQPKRFRLNAPGDFYVADGECITCLLPARAAPTLMGLHEAELSSGGSHCFFARQPQSTAEFEAAILALQCSCCGALRYGGRDAVVLARLKTLGLEDQCDWPG